MASETTPGSANSDEDDAQMEEQTDTESSRETREDLNESDTPTEEMSKSTSKERDKRSTEGETQPGKQATGALTDAVEKSNTSNRAGSKNNENANSKTEELVEPDVDPHEKQSNFKDMKERKKKADATRKTVPELTNRLEYLARPRKDFLDSLANERLDGAVPENAYPFWNLLPLQTKIPFAQCPMPIARKQLGTNVRIYLKVYSYLSFIYRKTSEIIYRFEEVTFSLLF